MTLVASSKNCVLSDILKEACDLHRTQALADSLSKGYVDTGLVEGIGRDTSLVEKNTE